MNEEREDRGMLDHRRKADGIVHTAIDGGEIEVLYRQNSRYYLRVEYSDCGEEHVPDSLCGSLLGCGTEEAKEVTATEAASWLRDNGRLSEELAGVVARIDRQDIQHEQERRSREAHLEEERLARLYGKRTLFDDPPPLTP